MQFSKSFLTEAIKIIEKIDLNEIENLVLNLEQIKLGGGRLFFCGVGGSAANASHAVNDFRKLAGLESYSPTDNFSEITARINDESWAQSYVGYLKSSKLNRKDAIFVLSVGGGSLNPLVSENLVYSIDFAKQVGAKVFGIVGRDGGYSKLNGDAVVVIPNLFPDHVTPHCEGLTALVWHLLVSHPNLKNFQTKW